MNCQEFDQIVNDLAQPRLLDVNLRERGLVHATTCQRCALLFSNTRSLVDGLKVLAASADNSAASIQTEEILLAAFRQQQIAASSANPSNVVPFRAKETRRFPMWAYAAAAAIVIGFIGFAAVSWLKTSPKQTEITLVPSPSPFIAPQKQIANRPELAAMPTSQSSRRQLAIQKNVFKEPKPAGDGSSVQASLGDLTPLYREEIATDFMPLTHDTDSQPMESGQVIRVQVPRTALASFGLPINIERANELVKADLLLAEDGSARAIRFIR